jgi:phage tail-like protein
VRVGVDGLLSPHPLGDQLPALYQDDGFALRFTDALDGVLAPVLLTLDNLEAYVDPLLTASDFVALLAGWVGVRLDGRWTDERCRDVVASATSLYRRRATLGGLAREVALLVDGTTDVRDNGGVATSTEPGAAPPGDADPRVIVTVASAEARARLMPRIRSLVPAHVAVDVVVVEA